MQHVYQPMMIKTLLESENKATVRDIARSFLQLDESQIDYYKVVTNQMPGRVLKDHGIVSKEGNFYYNVTNWLQNIRLLKFRKYWRTRLTEWWKKKDIDRYLNLFWNLHESE